MNSDNPAFDCFVLGYLDHHDVRVEARGCVADIKAMQTIADGRLANKIAALRYLRDTGYHITVSLEVPKLYTLVVITRPSAVSSLVDGVKVDQEEEVPYVAPEPKHYPPAITRMLPALRHVTAEPLVS